MNDERVLIEEGLSDEEFRRLMRMINDSSVVPVAHLKDIAAWLRYEGMNGRYIDSDGIILFSSALVQWMAEESRNEIRRIIN